MKLTSRGDTMSKCHLFCVLLFLIITLIISIAIGSFHKDMLIYDEGNTYSCTKDLNGLQEDEFFADNQYLGQQFSEDPISLEATMNMFYDPFKCAPIYFYPNQKSLWFGRVENLERRNQHIFVYGYVVSKAPNKSN